MKTGGNSILITGGGSGIGRALAHRWHDADNTVIVTGRRRDMLDETTSGRDGMTAYAHDIDDPAAIAAFAAEVIRKHPALNVLVNNAGIYSPEAPTRKRDLSDAERMIVTNVLGPIRMIDAFVDHLSGMPGAALINVTSGTGFVPYPASPTYSATKAAVHSYTVALRPLLKDRVEVIEIVPPQVQTELSPGQSKADHAMPLDAYADDVMALLHANPTPAEICVERVRYWREAEAKGYFEEALALMVAHS